MSYLTQGRYCPHLINQIVDLLIKGQEHHESIKPVIDLKVCPVKLEARKPIFCTETCKNFTGRDKELTELTKDITEGTSGKIRSHSFRSGLATEMGLAGFKDEEIMAAGRWSSGAFRLYCKLPRSKRCVAQHKLVQKVMRNGRT